MPLQWKRVQDVYRSEDGPTVVEYALMLALTIIVCLTAISALGTKANNTFKTLSNKLGSAPC